MAEKLRRNRFARSAESPRKLQSLFIASAMILGFLTAPACGSCWPAGSCHPGSSNTPSGEAGGPQLVDVVNFSKVDLWNCNTNQQDIASGPYRPVTIYLQDMSSSPWQLPTPGPVTLEAQYN